MGAEEEGKDLRDRLADVLASGGMGMNQVSQEVLYLLPDEFIEEYVQLFWTALAGDVTVRGRNPDEEVARVPGKYKDTRVYGGVKKYKKHWLIKDWRAFEFKKRIDKKLVSIGREMKAKRELIEDGRVSEVVEVRCDGCGRFWSKGWRYCPWCGHSHRVQGRG